MAMTWYPVIDYVKCIECGECVDNCPHDVYDKKKTPSPVVVLSEGCVEGCHGCGNSCPVGAIEYVGENTDWTPPKGKKEEKTKCCCGGGKNSEGCC